MAELRRRCRDCRWWVVRTGCVNPALRKSASTVAIIPPKAQIYKRTECPYFEGGELLK
jgi:hypothetical protein